MKPNRGVKRHKTRNHMFDKAIKEELIRQNMSRHHLAKAVEKHVPYATTMQYLAGRHDMVSNKVAWILEYLELNIRK